MTTLDSPPITKFLSGSSSSSKRDAAPDASELLLSSQTSAPGGGILNNAHEARNSKLSGNGQGSNGNTAGNNNNGKVAAALKGMFKHNTPGKQIKVDPSAGPLGKTFERQQPIPKEKVKEIKGPEVLSFDPRGEEATAGDGVILTSASPATAATSAGEATPTVAPNLASERSQSSAEANREESTPPSAEPETMTEVAPHRRPSAVSNASSTAVSTNGSYLSSDTGNSGVVAGSSGSGGEGGLDSSQSGDSVTSGSGGSSIRFCPLPVSGRLKRANSITIGVAARSHLLQSQGQARPNYMPPMPYHNQQHQHLAVPQQQQQQQQMIYRRQEDIIDVGEIVQKGAIKAWRKMRGRSASRDSNASSNNASSKDAADHQAGEKKVATRGSTEGGAAEEVFEEPEEMDQVVPANSTGAAATKPEAPTGQTATSAIAAQHAIGGNKTPIDGALTPDGTRTPRAGNSSLAGGALANEDALPHLTRRLSTGTFLKDQSLTQIQETRRRELLGQEADQEDEDATPEDAEEFQRLKDAHIELEGHANHQHHVEPAEQRGWISGLLPKSLANAAGFEAYTEEQGAKRGRDSSRSQSEEGTDDEESSQTSSQASKEDEDDEETREAERLADEAMKNHSGQATKAGGFERIERSKR